MRILLVTFILFILIAGCSSGEEEHDNNSVGKEGHDDPSNVEIAYGDTTEGKETKDMNDSNQELTDTETDKTELNQTDTETDQTGTNQTEKDQPETKGTDDSVGMTEEDAVQKVRGHLDMQDDEEVNIHIDREEEGKYMIQVFYIVEEGGNTHTSTIGWYSVDQDTGEIDSLF